MRQSNKEFPVIRDQLISDIEALLPCYFENLGESASTEVKYASLERYLKRRYRACKWIAGDSSSSSKSMDTLSIHNSDGQATDSLLQILITSVSL